MTHNTLSLFPLNPSSWTLGGRIESAFSLSSTKRHHPLEVYVPTRRRLNGQSFLVFMSGHFPSTCAEPRPTVSYVRQRDPCAIVTKLRGFLRLKDGGLLTGEVGHHNTRRASVFRGRLYPRTVGVQSKSCKPIFRTAIFAEH